MFEILYLYFHLDKKNLNIECFVSPITSREQHTDLPLSVRSSVRLQICLLRPEFQPVTIVFCYVLTVPKII